MQFERQGAQYFTSLVYGCVFLISPVFPVPCKPSLGCTRGRGGRGRGTRTSPSPSPGKEGREDETESATRRIHKPYPHPHPLLQRPLLYHLIHLNTDLPPCSHFSHFLPLCYLIIISYHIISLHIQTSSSTKHPTHSESSAFQRALLPLTAYSSIQPFGTLAVF